MSKGTQIIPVRVTKAMLAELNSAIISRNKVTRKEIWTRSDFIRQAIADRLAWLRRSKKGKTIDEIVGAIEEKGGHS